MYKNILLPTDGSPLSKKAIESGIVFAKSIGAKVVGLYVSPKLSFHDILEIHEDDELWGVKEAERAKEALAHSEELGRSMAEKYLSSIEKKAKEAGLACEKVYLSGESPADGIVRVAEEKGCDLIFMASHGRTGLSGALLGSITRKVLGHSKIPVLVYRF
jgi:nucleotide-binding universal stress UspA family protein